MRFGWHVAAASGSAGALLIAVFLAGAAAAQPSTARAASASTRIAATAEAPPADAPATDPEQSDEPDADRVAAAPRCPDVEFVFARGSGEDDDKPASTRYTTGDFGMGDAMHDVYKRVSQSAVDDGLTVQPYGVPYPALGLDASDGLSVLSGSAASYLKSVELGAHAATAELERVHSACAATRVVVGGYSQGAQVIVEAVAAASAAARGGITAAVFFGDTAFDSSDAASDYSGYAPGLDGYAAQGPERAQSFGMTPVFDYCHNGDPICGLVRHETVGGVDYPVRDFAHIVAIATKQGGASDVFSQHTNYISAGDTANAAQQLRLVLGLPLQEPGTGTGALIAHLTAPGTVTVGQMATLNAGGTLSDPADPIVRYDWRLGGAAQSTLSPLLSFVPTQAGPETVGLTVTARSGATARTSVLLQVGPRLGAAPTAPGPVTATGSPGTIALSWPAVPGAEFYAVRDGRGTLLTAFTALEPGQSTLSWTDVGLSPGTRRDYQLVAVNASGASEPSKTIHATASADASTPAPGALEPSAPGVGPIDPELAWAVGLALIAVVCAIALLASRRD